MLNVRWRSPSLCHWSRWTPATALAVALTGCHARQEPRAGAEPFDRGTAAESAWAIRPSSVAPPIQDAPAEASSAGQPSSVASISSVATSSSVAGASASPADAGESNPLCSLPEVAGAGALDERLDIAYGPLRAQRLDLIRPSDMHLRATLFWVHGGGWTAGRKDLFHGAMRTMASLGYANVSVEYRMAGSRETRWPAGLSDVRLALHYVREHAGELGLDKRVTAVGASAGGHLVALLATAPALGPLPHAGRDDLQAVVAYYPPVDLRKMNERYGPKMRQAVRELLLGQSAEAPVPAALLAAATPLQHVRRGLPPFFVTHAADDRVVPVDESRELVAALRSHQVSVRYLELPTGGHGYPPVYRKRPTTWTCEMLAFLREVMPP